MMEYFLKKSPKATSIIAMMVILGVMNGQNLALAQPITPASDGTGTQVNQNENRFDITGGSLTGDNANLFHSFEKFGLEPSQIANFLANPQLQNIIGRVTGGDPSIINGIVQVTGGNVNLYLMNPSGVVFGADAQLNVPGSFTATTADGIQFNGGWFSAAGGFDPTPLTGEPNAFAFSLSQPGAVINAGNLEVNAGESLNLLGGVAINTGELTAPEGQILVLSVPGEQFVRLSMPGNLLSLEIQSLSDAGTLPNDWTLPVSGLPGLLTTGAADYDLGLSVAPDGSVQLTTDNVGIPSEAGTSIVAGQIDVSGQTGGDVGIFGERVGLVDAAIEASGQAGGGRVRVGGDFQGEGTVPNANQTFIDENSVIRANALLHGDGGTTIIWADGSTEFHGRVEAQGGANAGDGGFAEISGKENLAFRGTVDLTAENGSIGTLLLDPENIRIIDDEVADNDSEISATGDGQILSGDGPGETFTISEEALESVAETSDITLQAMNNIILEDLQVDANGGGDEVLDLASSATFTADSDNDGNGSFITVDQNDTIQVSGLNFINISGASVTAGNISARNIEISATAGSINAGSLSVTNANGPGGSINLTSTESIATEDVNTSGGGNGGSISIESDGEITTGVLNSSGTNNNGGDITLTNFAEITTGDINTSGLKDGGDVTIQSVTGITTGSIDTSGDNWEGGTVSLSAAGDIEVDFIDTRSDMFGGRVDITTENYFRVNNVIPSTDNASISTSGPLGGGSITIRHGGEGNEPFIIGNANLNGTLGNVTSGDATLPPRRYFFKHTELPNIRLITTSAPEGDVQDEPGRTDKGDVPPNFQSISACIPINADIALIDSGYARDFEEYLGTAVRPDGQSLIDSCEDFGQVAGITGIQPAIIYLNFVPAVVDTNIEVNENNQTIFSANPTSQEELEIILVIPEQPPIRHRVHNATREQIMATVQSFQNDLLTKTNRYVEDESSALMEDTSYVPEAKQLYNWIISPLRPQLEEHDVENLVFIADSGLRSVPYAALYDSEHSEFLIEQYSTGLMPSLSLTDTRLVNIEDAEVLAIGRDDFSDEINLTDLFAPTFEAYLISNELWRGEDLLEEEVTRTNLATQREGHGIVHIATHAKFEPGEIENSYIQLWGEKLRPSEMQSLGWNNPSVKLLVLSACETAIGDPNAELGFAGFAAQAGVQSVMASLWAVDDVGTLALMTEFYNQLDQVTIKAKALQEAQIAMLRGQVSYDTGQLRLPNLDIEIPMRITDRFGTPDLSHPYYWSAFTMIGNPW